ncbi:MAG: PASTA domain-containing protein [Vulcanimicrobiaceae bacterium]
MAQHAESPEYQRTSLPNLIERYIPRDWVFPIVLAVFVGVLVWFGRSIHDFLLPPANTVTVPSFIGQALPDAQTEIVRLKLKGSVIGEGPSNQYPKGVVMNQQPGAGMHVRAGRQISLVVSTGVQTELMPDVRYQSLREAGLDLSRARLQLAKTTYVKNDDIPADHVIDQSPQPLINVTEGTSVTLLISKGGATQIKVPAFTKMSIDQARALAAQMHVKLGQVVWTPLGVKGPPRGEVVHQKPAAGAIITPFDVVSLNVSAGPKESGYLLRQAHVLASVPEPQEYVPGQALHVRMAVTDDTGQYNLFDGFAQPGQKMDFNVTTIGASVVDFYVNNVLVGETRLGEEPKKTYPSPLPTPQPSGKPSPSPNAHA